jgi:multicomponent Na+:H+ antiporter subunit F
MMDEVLLLAALLLLFTMVAGLVRISRGPTAADRMLAALLFGSTGVAILVLLSQALALPVAVDVALVIAVLAAVVGVAFATRSGRGEAAGKERPQR